MVTIKGKCLACYKFLPVDTSLTIERKKEREKEEKKEREREGKERKEGRNEVCGGEAISGFPCLTLFIGSLSTYTPKVVKA